MQILQVMGEFVLAVAAGLLLSASELRAYRFEFIASVDGERKGGAEVCFHAARDPHNPAKRFFASNEVRCLPADYIVDVPAGAWNVFTRHVDGWISDHGTMISSAASHPGTGYRALEMGMVPAAFLDFRGVDRSDDFAVYVPNAGDERLAAAVYPLTRGEDVLPVPADHELVVVRSRAGIPMAVTTPMKLSSAATVSAAPWLELPPAGQLVAVVVVESSGVDYLEYASAPRVVFKSGERVTEAWFPFGFPGEASSAVLFFGGLSGRGHIEIGGDGWTTTRSAPVIVGAGTVFISDPLVLHPDGRIRVHIPWPAGPPLEQPGECGEALPIREWSVRLLRCADAARGGAALENLGDCSEVSVSPAGHGDDVVFHVPAHGTYIPVLMWGDTPVGSSRVQFGEKDDEYVEISFRKAVIGGRVTNIEAGVRARLTFGSGETTTTALDGSYQVALNHDHGDLPIEAKLCNEQGVAFIRPSQPIVGSGWYDLEIPRTRVELKVRNAEGDPVAGALVARSIFESRSEAAGGMLSLSPDYENPDAVTDAEGTAIFRGLPEKYFLRLCAVSKGFGVACADPFELRNDREQSATIELTPRTSQEGIVVLPGTIEGGRLFLVDHHAGTRTMISVNPDGTFRFNHTDVGSHLVFVSRNFPLFVMEQPAYEDERMTVHPPAAPVRDLTVQTDPSISMRSGYLGLMIGGILVPPHAFDVHLTLRGRSSDISAGSGAQIPDVMASAPMSVILRPSLAGGSRDPLAPGPRYVVAVPADGSVIVTGAHRLD